jgi:hypothetical protein
LELFYTKIIHHTVIKFTLISSTGDYLTKVFPLTTNVQKIKNILDNLNLSGGFHPESNIVEGLSCAYQVNLKFITHSNIGHSMEGRRKAYYFNLFKNK